MSMSELRSDIIYVHRCYQSILDFINYIGIVS